MATASRTQQQRNPIEAFFHFLNPFKSKPSLKETEAAKSETAPVHKTAHAKPPQRPHHKRKRHRSRKHKHVAAASTSASPSPAEEKPQALDRHDVNPEAHENPDPAHRPGHRTFNLKEDFPQASGGKVHTQKSALDNYPNSERIRQVESPQRRINSPNRMASKRGKSMPKSTSH